MPTQKALANLKPHEKGFEPDREASSRGGKASGETRRKRKLIRESLQAILAAQCSDEAIKAKLEEMGMDSTYADAIALAMGAKAVSGDVEAARFVRDSSGERPAQGVDLSVSDRPVSEDAVKGLSDEQLRAMIDARSE